MKRVRLEDCTTEEWMNGINYIFGRPSYNPDIAVPTKDIPIFTDEERRRQISINIIKHTKSF